MGGLLAALGPSLISSGLGLVGGLLGAKARKEQAEEERKQRGMEMAFKSRQEALQNLSRGQQEALQGLVQGFRQALIR